MRGHECLATSLVIEDAQDFSVTLWRSSLFLVK